MNSSGIKTHNLILSTATELFMEKGFSAVTMSDLCERCQLSRGGLYRHFQSTSEIFEEMLNQDKDIWSSGMDEAMEAGISAKEMLKSYLDHTRAGILHGEGRISLAAYEYVRSDKSHTAFAQTRYQTAVSMMKTFLAYGVKRNEFILTDLQSEAEQLVILIDGIRIASVFSIDSDTVAKQLKKIYSSITREEMP